MKKIGVAILLIWVSGFNLLAQISVPKEEYAVYAAIMDSIYARDSKHAENETSFVIFENTIEPNLNAFDNNIKNQRVLDYLYEMNPPNKLTAPIFEDLFKDLKKNNKDLVKLDGKIPLEYKYSFISKAEIDKLLEQGKKEYDDELKKCNCLFFSGGFVWQPFFRKYKNYNGYYSFSKVGFSPDKQFALVFVKTESGDQGSSTFYILEKVNDKWEVRKNFGSSWVT